MSFIDTILSRIGLERKGTGLPLAESTAVSSLIIPGAGKNISNDRAIAEYRGWTYACVRAIAEEIANMELRLFQKKGGEYEEIFEHELLDLLNAVNPHMTGFELKYLLGSHLELTGNAYWLLEGVEKEGDQPTAIYPLNPRFVKVQRGELPEFITGYKYEVNGKGKLFQPYQILHIKYPDPNDPFEGVGTIQNIIQWVDADNYASEYNKQFFQNAARPNAALETEQGYTPDQLKYIRESFDSIYRGVRNAHKTLVLPKGTKFNAVGWNQKDMDFVEMSKDTRDKILAGFRVPKTVLGISDDVNRANAEATNYVFALRTIKPKMQMIVAYLNEFLVPSFGDDIYLDFHDPVPENREQKVSEMGTAMAGQPIMSVNEARENYFGLPAIDNGDAVMTNFSNTPLGTPEKKQTRHAPVSKAVKKKGSVKTQFERNSKKRKEMSDSIASKAAEALKGIADIKVKNIADLSDEEFAVYWKKFESRITPQEKALKKQIEKFNADQKEEVLKNLASATKDIDPSKLFDKDKQIGLLVDLATPLLVELFAKEGKEALAMIGIEAFDILTPEVKKALNKTIELMSTSYNETALEALRLKLEAGQKEGMSLPQLKEVVGQVYEFQDEVKAAQVAKTEAFRIGNEATREAWKQSEVVKTIKWYTAADEMVCEFCGPMNGKVVEIQENFFDKGDKVQGAEGGVLNLDYTDVGGGSLHPNCRCYTRPEKISI